jgi:hypothetical protein
MKLENGTIITLLLQTLVYVGAGWRYVNGLQNKISQLDSKLSAHEREMNLRLGAVEKKDTEINERLTRMEAMLVEIRLQLKDKADK